MFEIQVVQPIGYNLKPRNLAFIAVNPSEERIVFIKLLTVQK